LPESILFPAFLFSKFTQRVLLFGAVKNKHPSIHNLRIPFNKNIIKQRGDWCQYPDFNEQHSKIVDGISIHKKYHEEKSHSKNHKEKEKA